MKKKYVVTFTQNFTYHVEVNTEDEEDLSEDDLEDMAINQAYGHFEADMRYPVARTYYDDCEVEEDDEE